MSESHAEIVNEPPIAERHRLLVVSGPRGEDRNPWHSECSCGWCSSLMRFSGDAALLGAQHVIDTEQDALREAVNLALMHLEDPRAIEAVRAALPTPKQQEEQGNG